MSWCPKCKNEYRAGIKICPDCNVELTEELSEDMDLNYVPLLQTSNVEMKEKAVKYLTHCNISVKELSGQEEGVPVCTVLVPEKKAKEAAAAIQTILSYEAKEKEKEENGGVELPRPGKSRIPESNLHVNAKDRYREYKSSGTMLVTFSVLLIIFGILNLTGIITFMASIPSLVIIFLVAAVFLYLGVSSLLKTGTLLKEANEEEKSTDEILSYLKENFSKEVLDAMAEDGLTDELLYFKQLDSMKEALAERYPEADENYIDSILEDYCNSLNS